MRGPVAASWCLGLAVQGCVRLTGAQIYHFENVAVPPNHSLHTLYAFYVYSHEEAPDSSQGSPFVKFSSLVSHSTSSSRRSDADLADYMGIQLSILRYRDFWSLINPQKFCSTQEDAEVGKSKAADQLLVQKDPGVSDVDVNVYSHTVRFPNSSNASPRDVKKGVLRTGVYVLVFSNCGDFIEGTVSGTVVVKNAYGFLPGNEYHKMPFYGWLLLVYVVLAVAWMVLSLRWWKELFNIQHCVTAVILLGLLESFLWWLFFTDWNSNGVRGKFLFVSSILFTVVKSTFSYVLVLVASLGWGVTRPYLDPHVVTKIQILCIMYIILDFIREVVLSFRHSHSLSLAFVLLCLLPVSLLNGGIFYWVFTALSNTMETLQDRRQTEKLLLFQRLWRILVGTLAIATLTLLYQLFNLSRNITTRWRSQWLLTDGVSHVLFLLVLAAMMCLWAPHKYSQRFAYSQQIDGNDKDPGDAGPDHPGGAVWADEDVVDDDGEEGESFWAATRREAADGTLSKTQAPATVIGAVADEESAAERI